MYTLLAVSTATPGRPPVSSGSSGAARRVPQQARSRDRVARILDAAADLVVAAGVDALTTKAVAMAAQVPIASLYQYFADRDEILVALVRRDIEEMDHQVAHDLAALDTLDLRSLVATAMRAFVTVYHRRPAFVEIWLRGRTNAAISQVGRAHNKRIAADLFALAREHGLLADDATLLRAELAVEVGDRLFQLAFEDTLEGDPAVVEEGIDLVCRYLEPYARRARTRRGTSRSEGRR
jgi:AcrR family transcriptional regulator